MNREKELEALLREVFGALKLHSQIVGPEHAPHDWLIEKINAALTPKHDETA